MATLQHIYAAGGTDVEHAFDTVECFHTDLARWHELQSMPTALRGLAAAVVHKTPTLLEGQMARKRSTQWKMRTLR